MAKKNALGKGLGALLQDAAEEIKPRGGSGSSMQEELKLSDIRPNPHQPRTSFDEEALNELAASIKSIGIVQPITVREIGDGKYEIIAGERRYRASKIAGLETIPAYIRKAEEDTVLELALIENIQRQDLGFFEEAEAFLQISRQQKVTQEELAHRLGKSQAYVANKLRLLKLEKEERTVIQDAHLTERHARALLRIEDSDERKKVLHTIVQKQLTVRETEELVERALAPKKAKQKTRGIVKDVRLFLNTVNRAIDVMKQSGIRAQTDKRETEQYFEYIVRIPKA